MSNPKIIFTVLIIVFISDIHYTFAANNNIVNCEINVYDTWSVVASLDGNSRVNYDIGEIYSLQGTDPSVSVTKDGYIVEIVIPTGFFGSKTKKKLKTFVSTASSFNSVTITEVTDKACLSSPTIKSICEEALNITEVKWVDSATSALNEVETNVNSEHDAFENDGL